MKYLILVGDGMGDYPLPELGNKTPLQTAVTPAIDLLCRAAACYRVATVPNGFHPGSDVANMSLLGYNPQHYYTGRAPLEAASMGIELGTDETAFRCNLVTIDQQDPTGTTMVDFSAGHISSEEAAELIEALQRECGNGLFRFHAGISYRHLLVVKDPVPALKTVPPHDYIGKDITAAWRTYLTTPHWQPLVEHASGILAEHPVNRRRLTNGRRPANAIWPWGEGKMPAMPSLAERFSISGTMISAVDLLNGLGICAGLSVANVVGATGYIDTNYEGKVQAALDALVSDDLVFVHLEGPDEAAHQGRLDHKITAIEDFDAKIVAPITGALKQRKEPFRVVVTMDHFTPLSLQTHTADPVPALIYDSTEDRPDSGLAFDERILELTPPAAPIAGHELISRLLA